MVLIQMLYVQRRPDEDTGVRHDGYDPDLDEPMTAITSMTSMTARPV
jgi:hypothetical protein